MKASILITRVLSLLAAIGFLLAPMVTPSARAAMASMVDAGPMTMAGMDMAGMAGMSATAGPMDCCPGQKQHGPECPTECPWAALCVAKCFPGTAAFDADMVPVSWIPAPIPSVQDRNRDRMPEPPPPRPPRA